MIGFHSNAIDLSGQTFGRLTAIAPLMERAQGTVLWRCQCRCGNVVTVRSVSLRSGSTKSCGCFQKESVAARPTVRHGHARDSGHTPTYSAWKSMLQRCFNPRHKHFYRYGGRGISICARWRTFEAFLADVGPRPEKTSIERINNDGNYEPGNCRWATQHEQTRNMSRNRVLVLDGVARCVSDWSQILGVSTSTLFGRIKRGWTDQQALTIPVQEKRRKH